MEVILLALAAVSSVLWVPNTLEMLVGVLLVPVLRRFEPLPDDLCPTLSIIVPACNEAETVEDAMRSLLALDYPSLEIVAIDDRSTDATGEILDRLAASDGRLRVLHLRELPSGWLGKNHALQRGSETASGDWLLFTDADVHYQPDALRRVMALVRKHRCDHLAAFVHVPAEGFWEKVFLPFFFTMFSFRFRTWEASWRGWPGYVGIGAFNLLRAEAYRALGGHTRLRMEVADDIQLGKVVKRAGYRQWLMTSEELISVRWVSGFRGIINGLTKNAFAGVGYSWPAVAASVIGTFAGCVWPMIGVWVGPPGARLACAAALLAMAVAAGCQSPHTRTSPLYALGWPLAAVLFLTIIVRSGLLAERQGGVYWRGTFYSLEELRRGRV